MDTTSELAFGLENRGMEETQILKKVDKTVQELKLEKLMNRSIFDLSGGENRKLLVDAYLSAHRILSFWMNHLQILI